MSSNKFYADCWRKAKKDMSNTMLKYKANNGKEERLKIAIAKNTYQYFIDVENEVKNGDIKDTMKGSCRE